MIALIWAIAWLILEMKPALPPSTHKQEPRVPRVPVESWVPPLLEAARRSHDDVINVLPGLERRNQESDFTYSTRLHREIGSALSFREMDQLIRRIR